MPLSLKTRASSSSTQLWFSHDRRCLLFGTVEMQRRRRRNRDDELMYRSTLSSGDYTRPKACTGPPSFRKLSPAYYNGQRQPLDIRLYRIYTALFIKHVFFFSVRFFSNVCY